MIRRRDTIRSSAPDAEIFITDDDVAQLPRYNCLGFALGRMGLFEIATEYVFDIPAFLRCLRCQLCPSALSGSDKGFALFDPAPGQWHVAKHLHGSWYESKDCKRLRFVHQLKDLEPGYGLPSSYWSFDESESAKGARDEFVKKVFGKTMDEFEPIGDSMQELLAASPLNSGGSDDEQILFRLRELADAKLHYMRLKRLLVQGIPVVPLAVCSPATAADGSGIIQHGFALVDTGATTTFLAPRLISQLGLTKVGARSMRGATGSGTGEVFDAVLLLAFILEDGSEVEQCFPVRAVSGGLLDAEKSLDAVLGRDVLTQLAALHVNFAAGDFELVASLNVGHRLTGSS